MKILIIGGGAASCHLIHSLIEKGSDDITFVTDSIGALNSSQAAGASIVPVNIRKDGVEFYDKSIVDYIIQRYRSLEGTLKEAFLFNCPLKVFLKDDIPDIDSENFVLYPGAFFLDIRHLLRKSLSYFEENIQVLHEVFSHDEIILKGSHVEYQDIVYDRIIFCEGFRIVQNPFFSSLKMNDNWGQVLILGIGGLDRRFMYHHHHRLLPVENSLWWFGSNHLWHSPDVSEQELWIEEQLEQLREWLKMDISVVENIIQQRPTTPGQFPYIGRHPEHHSIYIMNGLGSRGMMHAARYGPALADAVMKSSGVIKDYDNKKFQSFF